MSSCVYQRRKRGRKGRGKNRIVFGEVCQEGKGGVASFTEWDRWEPQQDIKERVWEASEEEGSRRSKWGCIGSFE